MTFTPWIDLPAAPNKICLVPGYSHLNNRQYAIEGAKKFVELGCKEVCVTTGCSDAHIRSLIGISNEWPCKLNIGIKPHTFDKYLDQGGLLGENLWSTIDGFSKYYQYDLLENQLILDLESDEALGFFHSIGRPVDYEKLAKRIIQLQANPITYLWYPCQLMYPSRGAPQRLVDTRKLIETIATAVPNSKFVTGYRPGESLRLHRETERIVGYTRIQHCMEVTVPKTKYYEPSDIPTELSRRKTDTILTHVPFSQWQGADTWPILKQN